MFSYIENVSKEKNLPWFSNADVGFAFVILHELGHIVFDSFGRVGHRDPKLWNTATDYQINQFVIKLMKECKLFSQDSYSKCLEVIMKNFLLDPAKYEQMTSEMTYDDLYKISCGKGNGNGGGDGDPLAGDMVESDDSSMSDEERMARDIIRNEMKNYASKNADKLAGRGTFGREFSFVLEPPRVSLRAVFKTIVDRELSSDWGFSSRMSRADVVLPPNIRAPSIIELDPTLIKKVIFILDSSGSMSDEQLNDAINITKSCLEKYTRRPVWLIIHTDKVVFSGDLKSYTDFPKGYSGGTAFKPAWDEVARLRKELHIEPSVVLHMTDLFGEVNPTASDLKHTCKNPHRQFKFLISGSREVPNCGHYWHIDDIA
jgi:predicted metal-dependent peptidase